MIKSSFEKVAVSTEADIFKITNKKRKLARDLYDSSVTRAKTSHANAPTYANYNKAIADYELNNNLSKAKKAYNDKLNKINIGEHRALIKMRSKIHKDDPFSEKVRKKVRYFGGVDWKEDGWDLLKDTVKENKGKAAAAAGLTVAGAALIAKKSLDRKAKDLVRNKVGEKARKHYDKKYKKDQQDKEQEKTAMVVPYKYRSKGEQRIRDIASVAIPFAASIPTAVAVTAGGEIIKQRKKAKQRTEWEEKNKDRRDNHARGYYVSNYRGGKKYKNSKPYVQGKERSRDSQDSRTVRV